MRIENRLKICAGLAIGFLMLSFAAAPGSAQGKSDKTSKKEEKALNKEAKKLGKKAEEVSEKLGRNVVFCILAAHTTDVGTAQELRDKFEGLDPALPFGQFVAAVHLADRTEMELDTILEKLQDGMSLGQIARESGVSMGELRRGFGDLKKELARSLTNPPTRDCFSETT